MSATTVRWENAGWTKVDLVTWEKNGVRIVNGPSTSFVVVDGKTVARGLTRQAAFATATSYSVSR